MAISLLTSCTQERYLRSDIKKFIASFSIEKSQQTYLECSYTRADTETVGEDITEVTETKSINVKDSNNFQYDYTKIKKENGVVTTNIHQYLEKNNEKYFFVSGEEKSEKSLSEVATIVNSFFYTSSSEGIYIGGMFVGDTLRDIIYDIQDNVTIDSENKLLVYSYERIMKEGNETVTISQDYRANELGMLVSSNMTKVSSKSTFTTVITVENI